MKKISKSIQTSKKKEEKKMKIKQQENQTRRKTTRKDSWLESFSQFSSSRGKNSWFDFAKQEKYIKAWQHRQMKERKNIKQTQQNEKKRIIWLQC